MGTAGSILTTGRTPASAPLERSSGLFLLFLSVTQIQQMISPIAYYSSIFGFFLVSLIRFLSI